MLAAAMHEYGGLYLLSPTFGVVALSCSQQTQKLHTGWTITEYLDIEKSLRPEQDMIYYMDPENGERIRLPGDICVV